MNITSAHRTVQTHEFKVNGEWDIYRTRAQWKVKYRDNGDFYRATLRRFWIPAPHTSKLCQSS